MWILYVFMTEMLEILKNKFQDLCHIGVTRQVVSAFTCYISTTNISIAYVDHCSIYFKIKFRIQQNILQGYSRCISRHPVCTSHVHKARKKGKSFSLPWYLILLFVSVFYLCNVSNDLWQEQNEEGKKKKVQLLANARFSIVYSPLVQWWYIEFTTKSCTKERKKEKVTKCLTIRRPQPLTCASTSPQFVSILFLISYLLVQFLGYFYLPYRTHCKLCCDIINKY